MGMKKSVKNASASNRADLENIGNKEWRFVEIPYEAEMKFNDLLDARDFGSVTPAEMERQLRELLHEAPNFIDVYTIKNNPSEAEFTALVAYGIDEGKSGVVSTPIFGQTGGGATFTSYGTSSYTMPSYGVVASSTNSVTTYTRAIALDIVKTETFKAGQPKKIFELRAKSIGTCSVISGVFEEILESIFQDFPGQNGKARKITVEFKGNC